MYKPHHTQQNHPITTEQSESVQQNSKPHHVRSLNYPIENEELKKNSPHNNRPHIPQEHRTHQKQPSKEDINKVVDHHSEKFVSESMPEEYDLRNRKNFEEYCREKRARPYCPFLRKGRCPSSRCLYFHPIITFHEDYPPKTNLHPDFLQEYNQSNAHSYSPPKNDYYPENSNTPTAPPSDNNKSLHNQPEEMPRTTSYYSQPNYLSQVPPQTYQPEEKNYYPENRYSPTAPPPANTKSQNQPEKFPITKNYYSQPNYVYLAPSQTYQPEEENLSRTTKPHENTENRFHQRCPQMQQTHHSEIAQSSLNPNAYQFEAVNNQFYSQSHYHYSPISNLNQY